MKVVDAHVHFLDPGRYDYPWLTSPELAPIRRAFRPQDLEPILRANGVDAAVLVQTLSSLEETEEFLEIASEEAFVAGVVGWVDLTSPQVADQIARLRTHRAGRFLVGIRHQVHDEPDPAWLTRPEVRRGLRAVAEAGLAYDLLVRPRELPAALQVAQELQTLRFVVDHIAKPPIARGEMEPWAHGLQELAQLPNVWCKLSGMVTEADWSSWRIEHLRPYVDRVLEWFGPERLLFGSDWPVCLLAASYERVLETARELTSGLGPQERDRIFGQNAVEVYRLPT